MGAPRGGHSPGTPRTGTAVFPLLVFHRHSVSASNAALTRSCCKLLVTVWPFKPPMPLASVRGAENWVESGHRSGQDQPWASVPGGCPPLPPTCQRTAQLSPRCGSRSQREWLRNRWQQGPARQQGSGPAVARMGQPTHLLQGHLKPPSSQRQGGHLVCPLAKLPSGTAGPQATFKRERREWHRGSGGVGCGRRG